ncbi:hypothetical protein N9023_02165 [Opitutaceae bacterium]|nr:hypothetical protein [Opitutaceae bacterium]
MSLRRSILSSTLVVATLLGLSINASAASESVGSQTAPERDYRLFVGLNVEVSQDDHFSLIEGYANNRVRTDASPNLVSLRKLDDMRFTYAPKLSRNSLVIKNISTKKIASTAKAARKAMRDQQALQGFGTERTAALQKEFNLRAADAAANPENQQLVSAAIESESALNDFKEVASKMSDQSTAVDNMTSRQKILNGDVSTALLITASVTSPFPITDAYLVGVAQIGTEESVGKDVIFFDRIPRLDQKSRQIKVIKEGLPREFKVLDVKIHIYRNGQELVTDKSAKQFALTQEEALEYLALERVSKNRGKSLAPEPAWSLAPAELFSSAKADAFDFPMTVQVDETGKVTQIDPTIVVPDNVAALVTELPFFPGLEDGVAVASTAQVNLASFFR